MKNLIIIALVIFAASSATFCQTDKCVCSKLLANGLFDEYRSNKSEMVEKDVIQFLAYSSYEEFKNSASAGGSGDYLGSYGKFGFDANWNREQFEKHQKEIINKYGLHENSKFGEILYKKYASPVIVNAFNECLMKNCHEFGGIKIFPNVNDKQNITLTIRYTACPGQGNSAIVKDSSISGGTVTVGNPPDGKVFPVNTKLEAGETIVSIKRKENDPIQILLKIPGQDVEAYIPEFKESPAFLQQLQYVLPLESSPSSCADPKNTDKEGWNNPNCTWFTTTLAPKRFGSKFEISIKLKVAVTNTSLDGGGCNDPHRGAKVFLILGDQEISSYIQQDNSNQATFDYLLPAQLTTTGKSVLAKLFINPRGCSKVKLNSGEISFKEIGQ